MVDWKCNCPINTHVWLVGPSVCRCWSGRRSVIFPKRAGGKLHFNTPIGALVLSWIESMRR